MNTENQTLLDKAKEFEKRYSPKMGDKSIIQTCYTAGYLAGAGENNDCKQKPGVNGGGSGSESGNPAHQSYLRLLAIKIVNMVNERYSLELLTVDSAAMTDDILELLNSESSPLNEEREKEVEGLWAKVEFYRTATDKVRELVFNSPDIGAPCQPLYDAIENKINEQDSRIKELEEALRQIASSASVSSSYSSRTHGAFIGIETIAKTALKQPQ